VGRVFGGREAGEESAAEGADAEYGCSGAGGWEKRIGQTRREGVGRGLWVLRWAVVPPGLGDAGVTVRFAPKGPKRNNFGGAKFFKELLPRLEPL
jgi:hypothetical protein